MTNPEEEDRNFRSHRMPLKKAIREVIRMAHLKNSLVYGLHQAALAMERNLEGILLCIIGTCNRDDPGVQIHSLLIETVCRENNIPVLKLGNSSQVMEVLGVQSCQFPVHCVVIQQYEGTNPVALDSIHHFLKSAAG